jgi:hypothetical protein
MPKPQLPVGAPAAAPVAAVSAAPVRAASAAPAALSAQPEGFPILALIAMVVSMISATVTLLGFLDIL